MESGALIVIQDLIDGAILSFFFFLIFFSLTLWLIMCIWWIFTWFNKICFILSLKSLVYGVGCINSYLRSHWWYYLKFFFFLKVWWNMLVYGVWPGDDVASTWWRGSWLGHRSPGRLATRHTSNRKPSGQPLNDLNKMNKSLIHEKSLDQGPRTRPHPPNSLVHHSQDNAMVGETTMLTGANS